MDVKKTLTGSLIFAAISAPAVEIETNGQFRLRHENYDIYQGRADKTDFTHMRLRAGFEFKLEEGRKVFLAPQAVKSFGEVLAQPNTDNTIDNRLSSGDKYDGDLEFHEAYAEVPVGDFTLKMGKQELDYGDRVVIGHRNWTPYGQTFDAVKLTAPLLGGEIDLVYSKIANDDSAATQDDITLTFLYYKAIREKDLILDFYTIFNNRPSNNVALGLSDNRDTRSYGFRYKQSFGKLGVYTENIYQEQPEQDETEYNYNASIGYDFGSLHPWVSYMVASENYDQLYTNRHVHNGLIDIVGRRNLIRASAGLEWKINSKWNFKSEYFQFKKQSDDQLAFNQAVSSTLPGDINEDDIGNELDILLTYSGRKGEKISLGYMIFQHGDYFEDQETSNFAYLQYLLKF